MRPRSVVAAGQMTRRALFVSPEFPFPPTSGGRARSFHLLGAIAQWAETDLLTFSETPTQELPQALTGICRTVKVVALPVHPPTGLPFVLRNLSRALRGVNPLVDRFNEPDVTDAVRTWLGPHVYDLIVAEHTWIAPYIELFQELKSMPLAVLDAHNVESDLWHQYYLCPRRWWYRPAAFRYFRAMREIESRFAPAFDLILTTSGIDRQRFESFARPGQLAVVPNGTAVRSPTERRERAGPPTVGFLGSLHYPPNEASVIYLLEEIWPAISEAFPTARLLIAGESSSATVRRIAATRSHVQLVGYVAEVESFLDQLDVMVVPLRHGSGTRIKILDAWARALPVVSTTKGAEGIDHRDGEDILIADAAREFSSVVVKLLSDSALRAGIGHKAAERVQARYSWTAIGRQFIELIESKLAQPEATAPSPGSSE
ncbi:MAG: glycosyltransferase [Acidobacteria bacterium]|nr:glycosyltransferase [Acidobacteriota bacterium]